MSTSVATFRIPFFPVFTFVPRVNRRRGPFYPRFLPFDTFLFLFSIHAPTPSPSFPSSLSSLFSRCIRPRFFPSLGEPPAYPRICISSRVSATSKLPSSSFHPPRAAPTAARSHLHPRPYSSTPFARVSRVIISIPDCDANFCCFPSRPRARRPFQPALPALNTPCCLVPVLHCPCPSSLRALFLSPSHLPLPLNLARSFALQFQPLLSFSPLILSIVSLTPSRSLAFRLSGYLFVLVLRSSSTSINFIPLFRPVSFPRFQLPSRLLGPRILAICSQVIALSRDPRTSVSSTGRFPRQLGRDQCLQGLTADFVAPPRGRRDALIIYGSAILPWENVAGAWGLNECFCIRIDAVVCFGGARYTKRDVERSVHSIYFAGIMLNCRIIYCPLGGSVNNGAIWGLFKASRICSSFLWGWATMKHPRSRKSDYLRSSLIYFSNTEHRVHCFIRHVNYRARMMSSNATHAPAVVPIAQIGV